MWNPRGKVSTGQCCGLNGVPSANGQCSTNCQTFFAVCLGPLGSPNSCFFGRKQSLVLGANSFSPTTNNVLTIEIPFSWPVSWQIYTFVKLKIIINDRVEPRKAGASLCWVRVYRFFLKKERNLGKVFICACSDTRISVGRRVPSFISQSQYNLQLNYLLDVSYEDCGNEIVQLSRKSNVN